MAGMKTGRVALPATVVAAMGGPAMVLCLAGASPIATVATLRSVDTWRPTAGPEVVVPAVAAMAAWLLIAWLTVVTGLMLVAQLRGLPGQLAGRLVATVAPLAVRRLVEAALGVTLASGAVAGVGAVPAFAATPLPAAASPIAAADRAGTATAVVGRGIVGFDWPADRSEEPATPTSPTPTADPAARSSTAPMASPSPLPSSLPSPPFPPASPPAPPPSAAVLGVEGARQPSAATPGETTTQVVVQRGDSLWAIATRHLGPGATNAGIATEWPRWYAANRAVIGRDPNLLLPGQRLIAPH